MTATANKVVCGNVLRDTLGSLSFKCTMCHLEYLRLADYAIHLNDHFELVTIAKFDNFNEAKTTSHIGSTSLNSCDASPTEDFDLTKIKTEPPLDIIDYLPEPEFQSIIGVPKTRQSSASKRKSRKVTTPPNTSDENPIEKDIEFSCKCCKKTFKRQRTFLDHMQKYGTNTKNKPHKCTDCGKSFLGGCVLDAHFKSVHIYSRKKHKCNECPKMFRSQSVLKAHLSGHRRDTGVKLYKCDICKKSFPDRYYIAIHMRMHSGEKPFQCTVCGDRFSTSSYLSLHTRKHNGDLKRHKCHICEKAFIQKFTLREHLRVHTGERPLTCEICGKTFAMASNMRAHAVLHTGKKPYQCRYCDMRFAQATNRGQHQRLKHKMQYLQNLAHK